MTTLLRECRKVYQGEVSILLPRHRFPLPLDGDTDEERMEELIHKCSEIFEVAMASDNQPVPTTITRRFISWFIQVFSTGLSSKLIHKVLERMMKKQYYS